MNVVQIAEAVTVILLVAGWTLARALRHAPLGCELHGGFVRCLHCSLQGTPACELWRILP